MAEEIKNKSDKKKTDSEKLIRLCGELPDICQSFLLETGTEMALSTRLAYARELKWFFEFLESYSPKFCDTRIIDVSVDQIRTITSQDISRYLTLYKDKGHGERTLARKRASLSRFFTYLSDNRIISFNPVAAAVKVKIHQSDEVIHLDFDEQNRLLDTVEDGQGLTKDQLKYHDRYRLRDTALITLLLDTGMRVSEVHGISLKDIDFDNRSVLITRKGGNLQTIYFADDVADLLQEYIAQRQSQQELSPNAPLFVTAREERLSIRAIQVLVKKYTSAAIPGKGVKLSPHKMRSSFAMGFYEETKDILALQRKLGHKNLSATNIYAKATDKQMKETRSVVSERRNKKG